MSGFRLRKMKQRDDGRWVVVVKYETNEDDPDTWPHRKRLIADSRTALLMDVEKFLVDQGVSVVTGFFASAASKLDERDPPKADD